MDEHHKQALSDLKELAAALFADLDGATNLPDDAPPKYRRHYVRAGLAMVEGVSAAMRRIALADANAGTRMFTYGEVTVLMGQSYDLTDSGEVRARTAFHETARLVRFSFAMLARTYGVLFKLDVGTTGWRDFRDTIGIRNRLTHPKIPNDLLVTSNELATVGSGLAWFIAEFGTLAARIIRTLDDNLNADDSGPGEGAP